MSVFQYDPSLAKNWSQAVVNYLDGDGESVRVCSQKFSQQMEVLVQPNVWTGSAAYQNYQNFMETHNAMIKFINQFGMAFEEAMQSVTTSIQELEVSNLGKNTNVSSTFGTLNYQQISELAEANINQEHVTYDYAQIMTIGENLKAIRSSLDSIVSSLKSKINELASGAGIWEGDAATSARENLLATIEKNMPEIISALEKCDQNIALAGQNAQAADRG